MASSSPKLPPRSSSLRHRPNSLSTSHLPFLRTKCIYLLSTYTCSHFTQPFTNPTNIIHTPSCLARFGGVCSSHGYRYEFLNNRGELCEDCRFERWIHGGGILPRSRDEVEREAERLEERIGGLRDALENAEVRRERERGVEGDKGGVGKERGLTATEFLVGERKRWMGRSSGDLSGRFSIREYQGMRRGMSFENQRAVYVRRPVIGERQASIVIEKGWEYQGGNDNHKHRMNNASYIVSKGKKHWEDWWGKLKRF